MQCGPQVWLRYCLFCLKCSIPSKTSIYLLAQLLQGLQLAHPMFVISCAWYPEL